MHSARTLRPRPPLPEVRLDIKALSRGFVLLEMVQVVGWHKDRVGHSGAIDSLENMNPRTGVELHSWKTNYLWEVLIPVFTKLPLV
jgi:hypothetical protein